MKGMIHTTQDQIRRSDSKGLRSVSLQKEETRMRRITCTILMLLAATPIWAKPKVEVRIKLNDGFGIIEHTSAPTRGGAFYDDSGAAPTVFYQNVTVFSESAEAVAKNNGQWCIKGDAMLSTPEYHGTLEGNNLEIEIPQKNGKIKKMNFVVYDHKWRTKSDF